MLRILDAVAHVLYAPLRFGARHGRADWRDRFHLIPGSLLALVCDRYEARLLASPDWVDGPNLTLAEVEQRLAEMDAADVALPVGYRCRHVSITAGGAALSKVSVSSWCGCDMEPVYASQLGVVYAVPNKLPTE